MGRLIDAETFERSIMFGDAEDVQDVIYALRDYPTAYDPDKVVEQLEADKVHTFDGCINKRYAIEIVKAGGADEKH